MVESTAPLKNKLQIIMYAHVSSAKPRLGQIDSIDTNMRNDYIDFTEQSAYGMVALRDDFMKSTPA